MLGLLGLVIMIACIVFFYKVGEAEHRSGALLAVISFMVWIAGGFVFGLGLFAGVLAQVGLFAVLSLIHI